MKPGEFKSVIHCSVCHEYKPRSEFYPRPGKPGCVTSTCKPCFKISTVSHREEGKRRIQEYFDRMKADPLKMAEERLRKRVQSQKRRARLAQCQGGFTAEEFKRLCKLAGNRCLKCGEDKPLTVDHVIPVKLRGSNCISNLQPLCMDCNRGKGQRIIDYRPWAKGLNDIGSGVIYGAA